MHHWISSDFETPGLIKVQMCYAGISGFFCRNVINFERQLLFPSAKVKFYVVRLKTGWIYSVLSPLPVKQQLGWTVPCRTVLAALQGWWCCTESHTWASGEGYGRERWGKFLQGFWRSSGGCLVFLELSEERFLFLWFQESETKRPIGRLGTGLALQ